MVVSDATVVQYLAQSAALENKLYINIFQDMIM